MAMKMTKMTPWTWSSLLTIFKMVFRIGPQTRIWHAHTSIV